MATRTKRRVVVEEEPETDELLLQDILAMREPQRTHSLQEWLEAADYDVDHGGVVKIGTPDGKPMQVPMNGETFHIPPRGKTVARGIAVRLLIDYGETGRYRGRDQATGMSIFDRQGLKKEEKEFYIDSGDFDLKFNTNYLVQLPFGNPQEVAEETNTNEQTT